MRSITTKEMSLGCGKYIVATAWSKNQDLLQNRKPSSGGTQEKENEQ